MKTSWSLKDRGWKISWPERVSQHDVVYLSPPDDPMDGLPIGNGDIGGLWWTSGSKLHLSINKVDTWDDGPEQHFYNWEAPAEVEHQTTLRSCGRVTVDLGFPVLDPIYLKDFQARLGLADATVRSESTSAFGDASIRAYASRPDGVMVLRVETQTIEPVAPWIELSRFGSRGFGHWFNRVRREPALHIDGTATTQVDGCILIRQQLRTLHFVVGMKVVPDSDLKGAIRLLHSRAGRMELGASEKTGYTIYITVLTSENVDDPQAEVVARLKTAAAASEPVIANRHAEEWREFWLRSFVHLPDDYLANIWHVTQYLAGSSCRGQYPPHFCNGLWGWNHDFVPWTHYFHWNQQWATWPVHAADHAELAEPYLNLRYRQLPLAIDYAKTVLSKPGAFYTDVSDRRGYQNREINENHTPGLQIAMDFWRHYKYTGDKNFLQERAFPVMFEVVRWFMSLITKGEDGKYHVESGTGYESFTLVKDPITDLAMIQSLFPAVIEAREILGGVEESEMARIKDVLENLPEYTFDTLKEFEFGVENGSEIHTCGVGKGKKLLTKQVPALGYCVKVTRTMGESYISKPGELLRPRIGGRDNDYYGFPETEVSPVFPAGVVGIKDRGTKLYDAMVTQARLHPVAEDGGDLNAAGTTMIGAGAVCMGWCPIPIICGRLGLADETVKALRNHIELWQFYPQGFGHYGPYAACMSDKSDFHRTNNVHDPDYPETEFPFRSWMFRHFDNEAMPIVATGINEMLLQSHEGIIRLCPAVPKEWDVAFSLLARGGFKVSTQQREGRLDWVWIESRLGGELILECPWPEAGETYVWRMGPGDSQISPNCNAIMPIHSDGTLRLQTERGTGYLLGCDTELARKWTTEPLPAQENDQPKKLGRVILGKPRMF